MPVRSIACQRSVFQRYHSEKRLSEFYPQDGGESQLVLKLRYCHPMNGLRVSVCAGSSSPSLGRRQASYFGLGVRPEGPRAT